MGQTQDFRTGQLFDDGAGHAATQAGSVNAYGNYPETWYTSGTDSAANATDNTAFGELDVSAYEGVVFMNTTANVSVQGSIDGTNFEAVDLYFIDMGAVDGAAEARVLTAGTTSGTGPFVIETPFKKIRFLNEGAAAATVRYGLIGKLSGLR